MKGFSSFIQNIDEEQQKKIDRSAFLYLDPVEPEDEFAQCSTCYHFLPGKQRCSLFGKNDKVIADASCGLYINGEPHDDQEITNWITPKQAGYVLGQVRCENCYHYEDSKCMLFDYINEKMSDTFDLDVNVDSKGCCNGWQKKQMNEMSVPAGTTGKRKQWNPPMVGIRMASGKIEKHPPGKSGSSGGGGAGDGGGD